MWPEHEEEGGRGTTQRDTTGVSERKSKEGKERTTIRYEVKTGLPAEPFLTSVTYGIAVGS
jgi:hypothetical protein